MNDPTICTRRAMLGTAAAGWFALTTQDPEQPLVARTVVFVRHAEKAAGDDPELDPRGRKRAAMLAEMFAAAGVRALYATEFRRTRQTLAPLASKCGVAATEYAARDSRAFAKGLAAARREPDADVVVVAGHSNTVPQMVEALGGKLTDLQADGSFADDEYDRVVLVNLCGRRGDRLGVIGTLDLRLAVG